VVPFPRFSSSINWRKQRKKYKKNQKRRLRKLAEANSIFRKSTLASLARAMLLTAYFPLESQNSLAEDQERPGGRWMTAPQWWVIDNGCWTDSWLSAQV
jgi:hypothetical protein